MDNNQDIFLSKIPFESGLINKKNKSHLCPYPWTHFRIASNGEVVVCCRDLDHKTVIGNLIKQSVNEIWNGELMVDVRRNLLNETPENISACKGCDLPYDASKFSLNNIYHAAVGRMQLCSK